MIPRHAITTLALLVSLAAAIPMRAQDGPPEGPPRRGGEPRGPDQAGPGQRGPGQHGAGRGGRDGRPDNPSADMHMPPGRWWDDPNLARQIGLSAAQVKKMDDTFNGSRDHLIDLDASVRKADGGLQPLLNDDPIDRAKVMDQIERLTQFKAELEKAHAQMLLDIRLQLSHDQWMKLADLRPPRPPNQPGPPER